MLDRLHTFLTDHGISPKVGDVFIAGLLAVILSWTLTGEFDVTELKLLGVNVLYAVVGIAAPAAAKIKFAEIETASKRRRRP